MRPRRKQVVEGDLYVNHHCDKALLGELLGCNRDTIRRWENLAFWRVASFRDDYPVNADRSRDRTSPLSPYQCWVIGRIAKLMTNLKRSDRVRGYIAKNPQDFSLFSFKKAQLQVQKLA